MSHLQDFHVDDYLVGHEDQNFLFLHAKIQIRKDGEKKSIECSNKKVVLTEGTFKEVNCCLIDCSDSYN